MGRAPCCEKVGLKRGRWTGEEDEILIKYIQKNGEGSWRSLPKNAGLLRCGKSCRLRWINYLRADLKRGNFTAEEDETIIKLHRSVGNRWSFIASHLPGRTDNEVKNYWNSHLSRKIYGFRSSNGSLVTTSVDLIKMANTCKRRGGRVSRSVAKKYNKNTGSIIRQQLRPNPESSHQATENDATSGVVIHGFSTTGNEKVVDQANAVGLHAHDQKSGEKDLVMELVDIYEEEAERRSINSMHDSCCEGLEMFSSALLGRSPRKLVREIEVLGPYDQEHSNYVSTAIFDKIFQNELLDVTQNISNYEEKEKEGTISSIPDSTMISGNERDNSGAAGNLHAETGKLYQCFSPINSSYFEDDLVKCDLDDAIAAFGFGLWDGGDGILLWP